MAEIRGAEVPVARYFFGRRVGGVLRISHATKCGMQGKALDSMSVEGELRGVGTRVRTGKKKGGWQLVSEGEVPQDKVDVLLAERAIPAFLRVHVAKAADVCEVAVLMGLIDLGELRSKIERCLLDANWHKACSDEMGALLETRVTLDWMSKHGVMFEGEEEVES